jgi:hypothetical protein
VVSRMPGQIDFEPRQMKLRHAAALALVGWYLMSPPHLHWNGQHVTFSLDAPLREWKVVQPFDEAWKCDKRLMQNVVECGTCPLESLWLSAQCIATDDPRLKDK